MMRFEEGKFYAHDTSEYEITDNSVVLYYCRKLRKTPIRDTGNTYEVAELYGIGDDFMLREADDTKHFKEITAEEFAAELLKATLKGQAYLNENINRQ